MGRKTLGFQPAARKRDFTRRRRKFAEQIRPTTPIEQEYVDDFVHNRCGIDRFQQIEFGLFSLAWTEALQNLLQQLLKPEDFETCLDLEHAAKDLARRSLEDAEVKAYVFEQLREAGLDESSILAEAFRLCAPHIELVNRLIAIKRSRGDKALFMMGQFRAGPLTCLQETADHDPVPKLVAVAKRGGR